MKMKLAMAALLVLVAAGEPPAASDVVWVKKELEKVNPDGTRTFVIYTVPKDRGFLLREVDGGVGATSVSRVRNKQKEVVVGMFGPGFVWKSDVGIPFQPGDEVEVRAVGVGQEIRISGVLTKP